MKTGLIGLGAMGVGMARNLAKAGLLSGLYNRTAIKAAALAAELAVPAFATPGDLAATVDLLLICVSADDDVLAMVDAVAERLQAGSIVVDMSTVSAETARQAASRLAAKGVGFLDAPVSGGVEGAKNGTLAMMVGGDPQTLEVARPALAAMAIRIQSMGPVGTGQATKAVNQIMAAGINQAVTEALAFAEAQGLNFEQVVDVIAGGAAGNWFLQHRGKTMTQGIFNPGFKLALHHKDLLICRDMARKSGLTVPLAEQTLLDYARLMTQGFGDEDISALFRLKRQQ